MPQNDFRRRHHHGGPRHPDAECSRRWLDLIQSWVYKQNAQSGHRVDERSQEEPH